MVRTGVLLPDVVDHGGCDDLKAVRVAALGQVTVVSGEFHLEDLRQRDFLPGGQKQDSDFVLCFMIIKFKSTNSHS